MQHNVRRGETNETSKRGVQRAFCQDGARHAARAGRNGSSAGAYLAHEVEGVEVIDLDAMPRHLDRRLGEALEHRREAGANQVAHPRNPHCVRMAHPREHEACRRDDPMCVRGVHAVMGHCVCVAA